jgi:exonuclease SbcC
MDGRAAAAGYAEDAERLLAALESDVAQYARSKIASVILARTIEQYREKHQGPLIKRASGLFAQMTLNALS